MVSQLKFKRLVAREASFTTKSKDLVRFVLTGGNLEVSINGTFGKTLQVLRVDRDHSGRVSDQDDWVAVVPSAFLKVIEKISRLANVAEVPVFSFHGSCASEAFALVQLQSHGQLRISWESGRCEMTRLPSKHAFPQIEKISMWLATKQFILAVEDTSASEVQLQSLKAFADVACGVSLAVPSGAQGYALALCLAQILELQCPLLLVGSDQTTTPAVVKAFQAVQASGPHCVWACPPDAAHDALVLLEELLQAYRAARPFVHSLIGSFGVLEADLREALESAVNFLQSAEVLPVVAPAAPLCGAAAAPAALRAVGRAGAALVKLAQERFGNMLFQKEAQHAEGESLILLDLSDPAALQFLRQRQAQAEDGESPHVLALLPGMSASRSAWKLVAEPLAILLGAGEELPDLGLVVGMCLGDAEGLDVRDCVLLLEALLTAPLAKAAFQLQPFPQIHLLLAGCQELHSESFPEVLGGELGLGEVTASFSLWPTTCERGQLLPAELLRATLPAAVARGGAPYAAAREPRVWHLLLHEEREALVLKRAAGDFAGRAQGAFHFRGGDGPSAHLWSLASKLEGEAQDETPLAEDGSEGYSDDYEDEDPQGDRDASSEHDGSDP
eukprot:s316_g11.t1